MLVHCRVTPGIKFDGIHLFIGVERGTVRLKCLAQEHNTMSPAEARTGSFDRTKHRASPHALLTSLAFNSSRDIAYQKERENEPSDQSGRRLSLVSVWVLLPPLDGMLVH